MHIPDGFVSGSLNAGMAMAAVVAVGMSVKRVRLEFRNKLFAVPLLATTAAFIFAAQMLNFPIGGGTSGHFLGAVTAAALLGPWSACIVMSVVLVIQTLMFGDGGLTALGSNIVNMGVVGALVVYPLMRGLRALLPSGRTGFLLSAAATSWFSVVLASSACAIELALSGTSPLSVVFPAMAGTHAVIGIGEGLIGGAVLSAVAAARPDILPDWADVKGAADRHLHKKHIGSFAVVGLALALILALFGSPLASSAPDGLEKVAADKGFEQRVSEEAVAWAQAPFPDYKLAIVEPEGVSTSLAGLLGTIAVFGLGFAVLRLTIRSSSKT